MERDQLPEGFKEISGLGPVEAILGRRSRRFFRGAEIPDGVYAYKSKHDPMPLSELEKLLVVSACGSDTSWHHMIYRAERYALTFQTTAAPPGAEPFPPLVASIRARLSSPTMKAFMSLMIEMLRHSRRGNRRDQLTG